MKVMDQSACLSESHFYFLQSPRIREGEPLSTKAVPTSPLVCQTDFYKKKLSFLRCVYVSTADVLQSSLGVLDFSFSF